MPDVNLITAVRRACVAAALALSIGSFPAHAVSISVDGNLADIIGVVGTTNAVNFGYGDDLPGSAEGTEPNNGFDIDKVYAYFDVPTDMLYLGMSVYGKVGDSRAITDTTSTNEYQSFCAATYCNRSVFDTNETYGIQLYAGTSIIASPSNQLLSYNVIGANNGSDTTGAINNPWSLTITRLVSEANNGVEFSIAGLLASGAIPYSNQDLLIRFSAGSADINPVSTAAEDSHLLQMQVVPVPAAVWLFGSGLTGLVAVARKRRKTA